jgi:integrase
MARSVRSHTLETRAARLRLPVAKKAVFVKIGRGLHLGYRRNQTAGTWSARVIKDGADFERSLGRADDFEDANGETVFDFWQAQEAARVLSGQPVEVALAKAMTLAEAITAYEADLRTRGGDFQNARRVRYHLPEELAGKPVPTLTARDLRRWRDGLVEKLSASTVNRTTNALKAALNLAAKQDERIANNRAWQIGLERISGAERSRNVILGDDIVKALAGAAYREGPEFGMLVEVAAVTGARMGQISALECADLQADRLRLMMPASAKGRGKKAGVRRPVPIPPTLAARLGEVAEGRGDHAPLLRKPNGDRWQKNDHSRLFARVVKSVGLDPEEVTIYALRHSSIVRQILANVPIRVVAAIHDTSVAMIERTYSAFIADHADALARAALLDTGDRPRLRVV